VCVENTIRWFSAYSVRNSADIPYNAIKYKEITGHEVNQFTGAELTAINGFYRDKTPERFRGIFQSGDLGITQEIQGMVEESPGVYGVDLEGPEIGIELDF